MTPTFYQVIAGAQLLQVFESTAEYLGPDMFDQYCLPYLEEIAGKVRAGLGQRGVPEVGLICTFEENFFELLAFFHLFWPGISTKFTCRYQW